MSVVPRIVCKDGASLSVQASEGHYCAPRSDEGPWTHFEVGSPSVDPGEEWAEFIESVGTPSGLIYAYVPGAMIDKFIAAHGGRAA